MNRLGLLRGLSRGMQVFVLVDVLLVLLLVVLVVTLPRSGGVGGARAAAASPAASAEPTSDPGDGDDAEVEPAAFMLPMGNIGCQMTAGGVECVIGTFTYAPPPVPGCDGETGHVARLDAEGFSFPCVTGDAPQIEAGATVLEYGSTQAVGDYTCASGTDGVTCTDAAGVGFRLARAQWNALP